MKHLILVAALLMVTSQASAVLPQVLQERVNNSALIPRVLPDRDVKMEGMSPDWLKTLIMAEFRIETATPEGTFAAATKVLDHYAEMGVNGLWIDPIWQRAPNRNGYNTYGPHGIDPLLTGADTDDGSFAAVRQFVAEAHKRNIRVLFDIIVWGTAKTAPLVTEHPEFYLRENGRFVPAYGGWAFDWNVPALKQWFQAAAVQFIERTGADGYRVDLAPNRSGYFFKEVRDALYARGHKIVLMSECPSERKDTFDFEQHSVRGPVDSDWFNTRHETFFKGNIVDAITTGRKIGIKNLAWKGRGGMFRFYVSNVLCHDDRNPFVAGNRVRFAYASIFAPYIPLWWIGEEWDNPKNVRRNLQPIGPVFDLMYFSDTDWSRLEDGPHRAFYEDVKRYIRIRRSYPEIFQQFPENARNSNIAKLETARDGVANNLQAYARFGAGKAILVVPNCNSNGREARVQVTPDYRAVGLDGAKRRTISDLMTGATVVDRAELGKTFTVSIAAEHLGIYLVEGK